MVRSFFINRQYTIVEINTLVKKKIDGYLSTNHNKLPIN